MIYRVPSMQRCDVAKGVAASDMYDFLVDIVPKELMQIKSKVSPIPILFMSRASVKYRNILITISFCHST